jgi:hypothetical protein
MNEFKGFFQSKTVWGGLIMLAASALNHYHYSISPEDQQTLTQLFVNLAADVGAVLAIVGRILATKQIGAGK